MKNKGIPAGPAMLDFSLVLYCSQKKWLFNESASLHNGHVVPIQATALAFSEKLGQNHSPDRSILTFPRGPYQEWHGQR